MKIYTTEELKVRKDVLVEVKHLLDKLKVKFFLVDGALLGAIRENNFIKWDWDIELAVLIEDVINIQDKIIKKFEEKDFIVEHADNTKRNMKINLFKKDNKLSITGLYLKKSFRKREMFKYPAKYFENPMKIKFLGEEYLAPGPIEEFLSFIYGSDWRTPKMSNNKREYLSKEIFNYNIISWIKFKLKILLKI